MSRCPGVTVHCPGCRDGGELVAVLLGLAAVAGVLWWAWTHELEVGLILAAAIVIAVAGGIWLNRRGGEVALVSYQALPAPERPALTGRPVREIPAAQPPQQITNYFIGYSPAEVARAVAEQQAIDEGR